jgi:hypothetical protein
VRYTKLVKRLRQRRGKGMNSRALNTTLKGLRIQGDDEIAPVRRGRIYEKPQSPLKLAGESNFLRCRARVSNE